MPTHHKRFQGVTLSVGDTIHLHMRGGKVVSWVVMDLTNYGVILVNITDGVINGKTHICSRADINQGLEDGILSVEKDAVIGVGV